MPESCLDNVTRFACKRTTYRQLLINKHISYFFLSPNLPIISSFSRANQSICQQSYPSATFYIHDILYVNLSCLFLHYCSHLSLIISQSFDLMFQRTKSSRVNFVNRPIRTKIWQAFLRYIIYCLLIFVLLLRYFSTKYVKQTHTKETQNTETNAKIYCMRLLL